jgi:hypothetical protein
MLSDVSAVLFWPFVGALGALYLIFRSNEKFKTAFPILTGIWLFPLAVLGWSFLGHESSITLLDVALVVLGASLVWSGIKRRREILNNGIGVVFLFLFGLPLVCWGTWNIIGDYLLARESVIGQIENLQTHHMTGRYSGPTDYLVWLNGHEYSTTKHLFDNLRVGDAVQAEIGKGSGYILRIRPVR